jgi:ankyrin repeat protein
MADLLFQEFINLVRDGDAEVVETFLSTDGLDLNLNRCLEPDKVSPLSIASLNGHLAVFRLLIEKGADVNYRESLALRKAVESGAVAAVKLLVEHGADVTDVDGGDGALTLACRKGNVEVVKALLPNGPRSVIHLKKGTHMLRSYSSQFSGVACPVSEAVVHKNRELVEWFLDGDVSVPAAALVLAADNADYDMVKTLLDGGANVQATASNGCSALMQASLQGSKEIVKLLLDHGAEIDARDNRGEYALLKAVNQRWFSIVELLLERGADSNLFSDKGKSASSNLAAADKDGRVRILYSPLHEDL